MRGSELRSDKLRRHIFVLSTVSDNSCQDVFNTDSEAVPNAVSTTSYVTCFAHGSFEETLANMYQQHRKELKKASERKRREQLARMKVSLESVSLSNVAGVFNAQKQLDIFDSLRLFVEVDRHEEVSGGNQ